MNTNLSISIVATTFNGKAYIRQFLDSVDTQTRQPDEVLIFDDGSTDGSIEIVEKYIREHNLENQWRLIKNKRNKGWRRNFMEAFPQASGDIIFSADQDDIWMPDKVKRMCDIMEKKSDVQVLACNLKPFYEDDAQVHLKGYQVEACGENELTKVALDKWWLEPKRPGCCMCFRKELIPLIEKLWVEGCAHDLIIWATAVAIGTMYIYNVPLIKYRRHGAVNTPSNVKTQKVRGGLMKLYEEISLSFIKNSNELNLIDGADIYINEMNDFFSCRYKAICERNVYELLKLVKRMKLYPKPASWVADVVAAFNQG